MSRRSTLSTKTNWNLWKRYRGTIPRCASLSALNTSLAMNGNTTEASCSTCRVLSTTAPFKWAVACYLVLSARTRQLHWQKQQWTKIWLWVKMHLPCKRLGINAQLDSVKYIFYTRSSRYKFRTRLRVNSLRTQGSSQLKKWLNTTRILKFQVTWKL